MKLKNLFTPSIRRTCRRFFFFLEDEAPRLYHKLENSTFQKIKLEDFEFELNCFIQQNCNIYFFGNIRVLFYIIIIIDK